MSEPKNIEAIEHSPKEPEIIGGEPKEPEIASKKTFEYDSDFVNDLVEKLDKRLQKKLYYGRKEQKDSEKERFKIKKDVDTKENDNSLVSLIGTIVCLGAIGIAVFSFLKLKEERAGENKA